MKRTAWFLSAVVLLGAAAWWRPGDSGHAIGVLSAQGGRVRHPVHLSGGHDRYTLVVTGTVLPPYRGDARVVVEGAPALSYSVYGSDPVVDLGFARRPRIQAQTLMDLEPRDRFTLWVVMRPPSSSAQPPPSGKYSVTFYDTGTDRPVLSIPVLIGDDNEEQCHEG